MYGIVFLYLGQRPSTAHSPNACTSVKLDLGTKVHTVNHAMFIIDMNKKNKEEEEEEEESEQSLRQ